jgi:uncharacterized protein YcbX
MTFRLGTIHSFPLKSGAALTHDAATVETRGLAGDRRWMVIDAQAKFATARQEPRLTQVRALPRADGGVDLSAPGGASLVVAAPPADGERVATAVWGVGVTPLLAADAAHAWISTWLGKPCRLVHMDAACERRLRWQYEGKYGTEEDQVSLADGFPLLVISQGALDLLNGKLAQPVPMLRFRPNLVVTGTDAHAEDGWRRIRIGACEFEVAKACTRCVLTTVDFTRGAFDPSGEPLRTLLGYRRRGPDGVQFGQNLIPRRLGTLRVGDEVEVLA